MDDPRTSRTLPSRAGTGSASGSATRLLILGCVRIFQPVHGYFLRRELISWNVDEWASVHPGSIYNALRSLTKQELLTEVQTSSVGARPARTSYRLTDAGEQEFFALLRAALHGTDDPTGFMTAVNMSNVLSRAEVLEAVGAHADALEAHIARAAEVTSQIIADAEIPDAASEVTRIIAARATGELGWARDYLDRVRAGVYSFAGEAPAWSPTDAQVAEALAGGASLASPGHEHLA